jgi:UDP-N-acetylmuramyl tripeptide synthase
MTKDQIDAVLDRVHTWPKARQEDAVRILGAMEAQAATPYVLNEEERADLKAALDEVTNGDLATEAGVDALFARHRA